MTFEVFLNYSKLLKICHKKVGLDSLTGWPKVSSHTSFNTEEEAITEKLGRLGKERIRTSLRVSRRDCHPTC